jgi:hypothetical protein
VQECLHGVPLATKLAFGHEQLTSKEERLPIFGCGRRRRFVKGGEEAPCNSPLSKGGLGGIFKVGGILIHKMSFSLPRT